MVEVTCATAFDERFDPKNVLKKDGSFWMTTGLYPHEITFSFNQPRTVNEVKFTSTGIRRVMVSACPNLAANSFKDVAATKDLGGKDGVSIQKEVCRIANPQPIQMLKFIILDGWDDFASVQLVEFN